MSIWTMWLDLLNGAVSLISAEVGLGIAVIITTLLLRVVIFPVSWPAAYRGCVRQKKMRLLQPELESLKEKFADKPEQYLQKMRELYEKNGISLFDRKSLMAMVVQMPALLGMYQALRTVGEGARFLWVSNLLKPDLTLAVLAGITTALMISVNPDLPEHMRLFMIFVPSIIAIVLALKFSSALAIYWATSNCFSAIQTVVLHKVVNRRIQTGTLKI